MITRRISTLVGLILAVGAADVARAQEVQQASESSRSAWVGFGLGYGAAGAGPTTEAGGFLAGRVAGRVEIGRLALSARLTETNGGPSRYMVLAIPLRDRFMDIGLLVGYIVPLGGPWEVTGSAGLARITGHRAVRRSCPKICLATGTTEPFTPRLGMPLELEVSVRFRRMQRISLVGYANLNGEEVFGGVLLSVSGRLW